MLTCIDPAYRSNDNVGILQMAREGYEAPFMSPILVKAFNLLYRGVSDSIPWFGIANYASLFWSLALLIHAMSVLPQLRRVFVPLLLLASLLWSTFLIRCGYNASSMLLSGVAILAFVAFAREGRATRTAVLTCALGLAFAFLFRPRGMQGATLWIAPALIAFGALQRNRYSLATIALFAAPIGTISIIHTVWDHSWMSASYEEFRTFNCKRGKFHVYPIMKANEENQKVLEVNGWKKSHYTMLTNWFFFNEDRWNLETISNIFEHTVELPHQRLDSAVFDDAFAKLGERYTKFVWLLVLVAAGIGMARSRRVLALSAGYLLYLAVLVLYMTIVLRFPGRVGDPLFTLGLFAFVWILASTRQVRRPATVVTVIASATWLVTMLSLATHHLSQASDTAERRVQFETAIDEFNLWFEDKFVYTQPAILLTQDQNPFGSYDCSVPQRAGRLADVLARVLRLPRAARDRARRGHRAVRDRQPELLLRAQRVDPATLSQLRKE